MQACSENAKGRQLRGPLIVYTAAEDLCITRRRCGRGWVYYDGKGARIADRTEIDRLNALAMPPAYADARFNPDPDGHLQALARDARGRRQYRYHQAYRDAQEAEKFSLCAEFGDALPRLRRHVARQLGGPPTARETVIAAIVRILDTAFLRIGNESYARANKSFGLTTLHNRHARLHGGRLLLHYRGKGGVERQVTLNDRSLARIVRRCQDLPGQRLFQYRDDMGETRSIGSNDINAYLQDYLGAAFSAKHFRTWHASVIAFAALRQGASLGDCLDRVAAALGNTPAVARKAYVHPALLEGDGEAIAKTPLPRPGVWMTGEEKGFLAFIRGRG